MEGFSPFYQENLFPIMNSLLRENGVMYVVGQEPYKMPDDLDDINLWNNDEMKQTKRIFDIDLPLRIFQLRDAVVTNEHRNKQTNKQTNK
jgi:hypothetical protein